MMTRYIALLRAVNVGGTGVLAMAELRSLCRAAGFTRVETYIASGNVVFEAETALAVTKAELAVRLHHHTGKAIEVLLRTAAEMETILTANPFPKTDPKHTYAVFLDAKVPPDALDRIVGRIDEETALGDREIFVHYPSGMGRSKLRIPVAEAGTARNMNTVAKLVTLASRP